MNVFIVSHQQNVHNVASQNAVAGLFFINNVIKPLALIQGEDRIGTLAIYEMLGIGIGAFVATNIDDLFILMVFFAKRSFPTYQIVLGQYVGMGLLLGVSLVGSLIALVIPYNLLGLVGLIPIAIGIKELVELRNAKNDHNERDVKIVSRLSNSRWRTYLPFLVVATITFSGGEEIGIYTSIFVTDSSLPEITTIVAVVMALTGVWCWIAAYLVNRSFLAMQLRRITDRVLPFVLIGLGTFILIEAFLIQTVVRAMVFEVAFRLSLQFWH
jgi:cadmium resistance protein CadD (predicted permease)